MSITTISLVESMLLHDRPLAWWGLDTADPLADDAIHGTNNTGYTLTVNGTPANLASLHTRGDTGASGCRDFDGVDDAYWTLGKVTDPADGPPKLHATASASASGTTATVIRPGGVAEGDLLIVVGAHTIATAGVTTAPAGYTIVGTVLNCGTHAKVVYRKTATVDDLTPGEVQIVWDNSNQHRTMMFVIRGCDPDVANLIFDSGEAVTSSGTTHASTSESWPEQSWSMVIWTKDFSDIVSSQMTHTAWGSLDDTNTIGIYVFAYANELAGSGSRTASTNIATTLGVTHITFGSPRKVLNDSLDMLAGPATLHMLIRGDSFATNSRTIIGKQEKFDIHVTTTGSLRFLYHDGTAWRTHIGPTLSTATIYRIWIRDDGTNISFFVNGTKTSVARFNALPYNTAAEDRVSIGAFWDGGAFTQDFDGRIDEPAIFEAALSDSQILAHDTAHTTGIFGDFLQANETGRYPRAKLEMALTSNPTDPCHVFSDMAADLRSEGGIRLSYGRNQELDRMQAGTMGFMLNNRARTYDTLKPTRVVRFRAQAAVDGPVFPRFFGYTDAPQHLRPEQAGGKDAAVLIQATDLFKALAPDTVREPLVRPTELAGVRIQAVLRDVPNLRYSLEVGHHLIIGADLQGGGRLEHAQAVAETDGGLVFASPLGVLVFHDNQHRSALSRTVQATYGWIGTTATLPCSHFQPHVDESRLFTAAAVTPSSGNVQRAVKEEAKLEHWERTKELATLHASDNDALAMAHHYANVYSVPTERVPALRLQPAGRHPASAAQSMWATVFGHSISDRIKTIEDPPGGAEVPREHFIEGISEDISSGDWVVTLSLSPVELEGDLFVIGTDLIGSDNLIGW